VAKNQQQNRKVGRSAHNEIIVIFEKHLLYLYLYRFGHPFELPLLIQSIVMNSAMLAMIQLCVSVQRKSDLSTKRRSFSGFYLNALLCMHSII